MILKNLDECIETLKVTQSMFIEIHCIKCLGEIKMMSIASRMQIKQGIPFTHGHVKRAACTVIINLLGE